jgi:lipopolysaccharide/colanic/teichoic acid biosynthesis glycosyltransferase
MLPIFFTGLLVFFHLGQPLFFRQLRIGRQKSHFNILKFRTMTNEVDGKGRLLDDEFRQTRVTRFIRRKRLDELPQLWAILIGHMALVGPRPLLPQTIDDFGELGNHRCRVKPGMTGWSQVSGNVLLNNDEKLKLDLWYVSHRSFLLDIQILFETIQVVLLGEKKNNLRIENAEMWLLKSQLRDAWQTKE